MTTHELYALLDALDLPYVKYEHEPVFTCEAALAAVPDPTSVQTKNLFLRDKRGRRHMLVITSCAKAVDIAHIAREVDADRLSFGSAERLQAHLGVTPGSVTLFGLVHDPAHTVELVVDAEMWREAKWRCHPLVNTATVVLAREGVEAFLAHTGHTPRVITTR
jgi:Ala-tRNA(Pro) deacylase